MNDPTLREVYQAARIVLGPKESVMIVIHKDESGCVRLGDFGPRLCSFDDLDDLSSTMKEGVDNAADLSFVRLLAACLPMTPMWLNATLEVREFAAAKEEYLRMHP